MESLTCSPSPHFRQSPLHHSYLFQTRRSMLLMHRRETPIRSSKVRRNTNHHQSKGNLFARAIGTEPDRESNSSPSSDVESKIDENDKSPSTTFLSVLCPLLKLVGASDPSQQRNEILEVATSSLSSIARLPWGSTSLLETSQKRTSKNLPQMVQLFEFEACPFCRRVREAMTELDLSIEVYPCPKGSLRHRAMVKRVGGKEQFPFLIDPNSSITMYESGDIVKYLFRQYGLGREPSFGLLESTLLTGWMPTILRAGRGMTLWQKAPADPPSGKLVLFSYENNPYARIVREALCELELPYILHNVGKGSSNQELLFCMSGSNEVPYLIDPNNGVQMGGYNKILQYLFQAYSGGN